MELINTGTLHFCECNVFHSTLFILFVVLSDDTVQSRSISNLPSFLVLSLRGGKEKWRVFSLCLPGHTRTRSRPSTRRYLFFIIFYFTLFSLTNHWEGVSGQPTTHSFIDTLEPGGTYISDPSLSLCRYINLDTLEFSLLIGNGPYKSFPESLVGNSTVVSCLLVPSPSPLLGNYLEQTFNL